MTSRSRVPRKGYRPDASAREDSPVHPRPGATAYRPIRLNSLGDTNAVRLIRSSGELLQQVLLPRRGNGISLAPVNIVHLQDRTQHLVSSQKHKQDHY